MGPIHELGIGREPDSGKPPPNVLYCVGSMLTGPIPGLRSGVGALEHLGPALVPRTGFGPVSPACKSGRA